MPSPEPLAEAERLMTICNACRYCEGFCAVFPAMERRRSFLDGDLIYLANLCHDCRGCYYACQYAPPHEFGVNLPRAFAELRLETYEDYSWPRLLGRLFRRNGVAIGALLAFCVILVLVLVLTFQGPTALSSAAREPGDFYAVVPYVAMVAPAAAILLFGIGVFVAGFLRFWRSSGGRFRDLLDPQAHLRASRDALALRYAKGGGDGCNYPDEGFSHARRWLHQLVVYGFLLDLASTTLAAIYQHFLHRIAPYPYLSAPVVLGTVGGVGLLVGTAGLLYLKFGADARPADGKTRAMDMAFLILLFLTSLTGLLLVGLRATSMMGSLLVVHLGVVAGLFITLPYGKLAHVVYHYAALLRNALEKARDETAA